MNKNTKKPNDFNSESMDNSRNHEEATKKHKSASMDDSYEQDEFVWKKPKSASMDNSSDTDAMNTSSQPKDSGPENYQYAKNDSRKK